MTVVPTGSAVLWAILPFAVLLAAYAPRVATFAAGQAGFTLLLVILFNLLRPIGWTVGVVRVEDVAIGFAISLALGLLFWPRGAAALLRTSLQSAYGAAGELLRAPRGGCWPTSTPPTPTGSRPSPTAAPSRRRRARPRRPPTGSTTPTASTSPSGRWGRCRSPTWRRSWRARSAFAAPLARCSTAAPPRRRWRRPSAPASRASGAGSTWRSWGGSSSASPSRRRRWRSSCRRCGPSRSARRRRLRLHVVLGQYLLLDASSRHPDSRDEERDDHDRRHRVGDRLRRIRDVVLHRLEDRSAGAPAAAGRAGRVLAGERVRDRLRLRRRQALASSVSVTRRTFSETKTEPMIASPSEAPKLRTVCVMPVTSP